MAIFHSSNEGKRLSPSISYQLNIVDLLMDMLYIKFYGKLSLNQVLSLCDIFVGSQTHINLQTRKGKTKSKRKSIRQKNSDSLGEVLESSKVSEEEIISPTIFSGTTSSSLCCISMVDQSEASYCNVAEGDANKYQPSSHTRDNSVSLTGVACDAVKEQNFYRIMDSFCSDGEHCDSAHSNIEFVDDMRTAASSASFDVGLSLGIDAVVDHSDTEVGKRLMKDAYREANDENSFKDNGTELTCDPEPATCSIESNALSHDGTNEIEHTSASGDWAVYWDSYYSRNYFYNIKTQNSTWYPPEGMEHLAICDIRYNLNDESIELHETDVSPALNVTALCSLESKSEPFEESMDNNILVCQQHDDLSEWIGLTASNSVSATTLLPVTQSTSVKNLEELNEINTCCKDGSNKCLSSNCIKHIARYYVFNLFL